MTLAGFDCSNNQGLIAWPEIDQSLSFALIKASEGNFFADDWLKFNWAGAARRGLVRLAYHFARPSRGTTPAQEASFFLNRLAVAGGLQAGDGAALDFEDDDGDLTADYLHWVLDWLLIVENALGFKPLLYSRVEYMQRHNLVGSDALAQYGLWISAPGVTAPPVPAPWSFWAVWQTSFTGSVTGVNGAVDLDTFNGTRDQLLAYGSPAHPKPQPTNNDFIYIERLLLETPPDIAGAIAVLQRFD